MFGRVRSSATVPGPRSRQGPHRAPDQRRLGPHAHHLLQPALAGAPVPRGLRGDVLRQGHRLPRPDADGQPGGRPARRGGSPPDHRHLPAVRQAPPLLQGLPRLDGRSRCGARRGSWSRCRPGCSTSTTSSTATRRSTASTSPRPLREHEEARRRLVFDELLRIQLALVLRKRRIEATSQGIEHDTSGALVRAVPRPPAVRAHRRPAAGDRARSPPTWPGPSRCTGCCRATSAPARRWWPSPRCSPRCEGGHQGAFMAPTEVLAEQHFAHACGRSSTASSSPTTAPRCSASARSPSSCSRTASRARSGSGCSAALAAGEVDLVVGTHALIQEAVEFRSLGAVVIDEQHRFGVEQRAALKDKAGGGAVPDVLVMTATPIPRTAAMTVYGDLDVSILGEKPAGRQPIVTTWAQGDDAGGGRVGQGARRGRGRTAGVRRVPAHRREREARGGVGRADLRAARGRRPLRPAARAPPRPAAGRREGGHDDGLPRRAGSRC